MVVKEQRIIKNAGVCFTFLQTRVICFVDINLGSAWPYLRNSEPLALAHRVHFLQRKKASSSEVPADTVWISIVRL